jgi:hypothetical protein
MRNEAGLFLAIMREANKRHITLKSELLLTMYVCLEITPEESVEIGEILKADLRELNVSQPGYGKLNVVLSRMNERNPDGL